MSLIYLIGYRGSGKTSVGRLMADQLAWSFIDTDAEIEKQANKSIKEIFADSGEAEFRRFETEAISKTVSLSKTVISLGGGACEKEANRKLILEAPGKTAWLTGSPQTFWSRISGDHKTNEQRPNLTGLGGLEEIEQLLEKRHDNYAACADYQVETDDLTPSEIAIEIVNWYRMVDKDK